MAIHPYVFKTLDEMTYEDQLYHLAAFNKVPVERLMRDPEFPKPLTCEMLEKKFESYINQRGGTVKILDVEMPAYHWLQAADPDGMSDKFVQWMEDGVEANITVRIRESDDVTEHHFDGNEIREYLSKKGF